MQANGGPEAILLAIVGGFCVSVVVLFVAHIFYLLSLSKCLQRISPRHRRMDPGQVWLNLIPFFNTVWSAITVDRLSESLRREFRDRGLGPEGDDYGRTLGLAYLTLIACTMIPYIGILILFPIGLIVWVVYWVRIAGYSRQLAEDGEYHGDDLTSRRDEDDRHESDR